jgi:cell division protein FtsB
MACLIFYLVATDPNLLEMVNKLKAENMKLRQENTRLQKNISEMDKNYELEIAQIKQQSLKIISEKEKEFEKTIERMDYDFREKLNELKE